MNKRLSIIIVTYNSENHIYDCLKSIYEFNDIGDLLEVIIVDNQSTHFELMYKKIQLIYSDTVKFVINNKNGGYGQGNNLGIKSASAPVIMIMNPDVRLTMPIFDKVCTKFESMPKIVMYGMKQMFSETSPGISFDCTSLMPSLIAIPLSVLANKCNTYLQRYMYFSGACFFVRKQSFMDVGLFDEDIFMYSEEDDIHNRLLTLHHVSFIYDPKLKYLHLHHLYRQNEIDVMNMKPYIERYKSQLIWKTKIGKSIKRVKGHYIHWVLILMLKSIVCCGLKHKKTLFYRQLINHVKAL